MPTTTASLALAAGVAALAAGAALAVPALVDGTAQAAPLTDTADVGTRGTINADGTVRNQKDILAVTRPARGVYCVRTGRADVSRTNPVGTSTDYGRVVTIIAARHSQCRDRADTYRVVVFNSDTKQVVNGAFHIVVP
ncbi:hypothetical protein [Actinomadura terrae]|uniref:hypothetical protein n=1 Tax=Actinomadura terrae TaxID=604353 RepID=UPI001FA6F42E|nr:hypothetical protein [Actinomadura terrae]